MPRTLKRPVGAPTTIDDIVHYTEDGIPVTAAERIIQVLETGEFLHAACVAAATDGSTLNQWIDKGSDAARKRGRGERLTANERRYLAFALEVGAAQARGRERIIGSISAAAAGAVKKITQTKKDKDGNVVETIERTEELPGDVNAAQWIAERRWNRDWGRRQQLEVTGAEGGPVQVQSPLVDLVAALDAMDRRGRAIEGMARELEPSDETDDDDASVDEA